MGSLTGKVALVTGAGGGIGSAVVNILASQGSDIALVDVSEVGLSESAQGLGSYNVRTKEFVTDISDVANVEKLCERVIEQLGGIDIVVNVAGGGPEHLKASSVYTTDAAAWQFMIELNLSSSYYVIRSSVAAMTSRGGGSIVNIASYASLFMASNFGPSYTAAKAGILGLTRHLAFELAPAKIRVNAVLPGPTLTPKLQASLPPGAMSELSRRVPLGRLIQPVEIAKAALFYASEQSSGCTGSHLVVDGGVQIGVSVSPATYFAARQRAEKG